MKDGQQISTVIHRKNIKNLKEGAHP